MLKIIIIFLLLFLINPIKVFAQTNSFVSVVNPVRGEGFWDTVKGQADILKKYNISSTWLLRFDAFKNLKLIDLLNNLPQHEKGIFLEITPAWANAAQVKYHESGNWHAAGSAFLSGYEPDVRIKLIDIAFEEFKRAFGFYPKSVGAWWIDSFSLTVMQKKYGITAALIVADQYTTDNYQIWGQYFSTPYYPAKQHALHPAQNQENKLPVVLMQWAARDPVNAYGSGVFESTFSVQLNDYLDFHNLNSEYFSKLLDIYTDVTFNQFGHLVVGLENSYSWENYSAEYQRQIKLLNRRQALGKLKVTTMRDFASWYIQTFPNLSPPHLLVVNDPLGTGKKAVWFMNPYFRAGWFFTKEGSVFRDIRQYIDGEEEPCYLKGCKEVNFATFSTRVLDEVTYGNSWVIDQGEISQFKVEKVGEKYLISYLNEAGNSRQIGFLPRDISIDGKNYTIDGAILQATKQQPKTTIQNIEDRTFNWSLPSSFSKILRFLVFLFLAGLIPGLLITYKILDKEVEFIKRIFLSLVCGLVMFTLLFYFLGLLKFQILISFYLLITTILFIRLYALFKINLAKFDNWNLAFLGIILLGTIFQVIPTFKSGLSYLYGLGFWGPNTHDGIWHISLINQLAESVPPQNPIFAGEVLKNYHYFYDLMVAATNYVSGIPILDLVFRFYPIIFSILLGIGTYCIIKYLFGIKEKLAILISLYLVYFAGSFGWIVEYIKSQTLGGESAFWANQSISFNLNPPFAISYLLVLAIFLLLPHLRSKLSLFVLSALAGSLIAFKAYGAILILISFILVGIFKKNLHYILVFLLSSFLSVLLFLSNFTIGQKLIIFSPFWFIHSMIDAADRVGWVRLSLARTTGLEQGNWFKFLATEAIGFFIFLIGNLGTRIFALLALSKIRDIIRREDYLFIFLFSLLAFAIPILFIQAGTPWNTIQFLYYFLYISALLAGVVFAKIVVRVPKAAAAVAIIIFVFITPINSWATANGYLGYKPHAYVSTREIEALEFLMLQEEGTVLTFPYDSKLKNRIVEPWPMLAYDSTAYVSALSAKPVYVEDEPQNQILLMDYTKKLVASRDFFINASLQDESFLKENNIKYIYLPKIFATTLDEKMGVKNIFENEEAIVYQVKQ